MSCAGPLQTSYSFLTFLRSTAAREARVPPCANVLDLFAFPLSVRSIQSKYFDLMQLDLGAKRPYARRCQKRRWHSPPLSTSHTRQSAARRQKAEDTGISAPQARRRTLGRFAGIADRKFSTEEVTRLEVSRGRVAKIPTRVFRFCTDPWFSIPFYSPLQYKARKHRRIRRSCRVEV